MPTAIANQSNAYNNGVKFPCVTTIHQDANLWYSYTSDDITITVDNNPNSVEGCRAGECPPYQLSSQITGLLPASSGQAF